MNENDIQGFHIELTNMCTLKCPGCPRTEFINQWPQHWNNYNLDTDILFNFLDIDLSEKKINLCGTYGDPIYHPDFLQIVKKLKDKKAALSITTNGSYKTSDWWKELTSFLNENDTITFSVDGLPENFTQYRINADWKSIEEGMKVVASSLCNSRWKYLVFAFNEDNISEANQLCAEIGIKSFELEYSDRFNGQTQHLIPTKKINIGERYQPQQSFREHNIIDVDPKCMKRKREHFITASGFYSPCCYIADHRFYYKTIFGKNKKEYDIRNTTITELLKKPEVVEFYNNLQNTPACQFSCPKI